MLSITMVTQVLWYPLPW